MVKTSVKTQTSYSIKQAFKKCLNRRRFLSPIQTVYIMQLHRSVFAINLLSLNPTCRFKYKTIVRHTIQQESIHFAICHQCCHTHENQIGLKKKKTALFSTNNVPCYSSLNQQPSSALVYVSTAQPGSLTEFNVPFGRLGWNSWEMHSLSSTKIKPEYKIFPTLRYTTVTHCCFQVAQQVISSDRVRDHSHDAGLNSNTNNSCQTIHCY